MKRATFLTLFTLVIGLPLFSQGKILNGEQLDREKWYYSLEEALMEPEKVYKLSMNDQKIKKLSTEIGLLTNLQVLNLSDNKIKKLPPEIGKLHNLQVLNLSNNKLKYLPEEMRTLNNLETLFLARNKLFDLKVWVGGLGKLRQLDVQGNRMTPREITFIKDVLPRCKISF